MVSIVGRGLAPAGASPCAAVALRGQSLRDRLMRASRRASPRGCPRAPSRPGSSPSRPRRARRSAAWSTPGTVPTTSIAPLVIPSPGWNVTVTEVSSRSGGVPAPASPCGQRHREARRPRRGDQLLGARPAVGRLGARGPGHVERAERPAADALDPPAAVHERARPGHLRRAIGRHSVASSRRVSSSRRCRRLRRAGALENEQPRVGRLHRRGERRRRRRRARSPCTASAEWTIRCPLPSTSSIVIVQCTSRPLGRRPGAGQLARERHREAAAVRRREQLLGARLALRVADPRRQRVRRGR